MSRIAAMADASQEPQTSPAWQLWGVTAAVAAAQTVVLVAFGRLWWCACGQWFLYADKPVGEHTSQHLLDPYSWSHLQHGLVLWPVLAWLAPKKPLVWQLGVALIVEAGWEVLENTPWIIDRYRTATAAVGYQGDTIVNSVADLICCAAAFFLARRIGVWKSAALFTVIEVATAVLYRDSLLLNVLMLLWPIDAIKQWQEAGWA